MSIDHETILFQQAADSTASASASASPNTPTPSSDTTCTDTRMTGSPQSCVSSTSATPSMNEALSTSQADTSTSTSPTEPLERCTHCNKQTQALRKCPCLLVAYCDAKCQSDHWGVHRSLCATVRREGAPASTPKPPQQEIPSVASPISPRYERTTRAHPPSPTSAQQRHAQVQSEMRQLMRSMERVAALSPRTSAQIVMELVRMNPTVLAPVAATLARTALMNAEAEAFQNHQMSQPQMYMMQQQQEMPPPPPLYSSESPLMHVPSAKQQQRHQDAVLAARMKKRGSQYGMQWGGGGGGGGGMPGLVSMEQQAWDMWTRSGHKEPAGGVVPASVSPNSNSSRMPSEHTGQSTPLKSSLDFDPNDSLASSIASAILED